MTFFPDTSVAERGGGVAWDVLESLPGFRIDGHDHAGWVGWPDRPGVILYDDCAWSVASASPQLRLHRERAG